MQFSYLTVYCICVLSTVYRCGCLRREAVRESIEHCIVASVCVLAELSSTADCVQKIFTTENASDVVLHMSLETCVPAGQPSSDISWFTDHPGARWLTQCWNKTQCQVAVEADGGRVTRVGAVLGGRKGDHHALNPHACPLTLTSLTGIIHVFHGEVQDLNCLDKARLGTLNHTGNGPGSVLWIVPFNVYHSFHKHRARRKFAEKLSSEREKRDTFEKNTDFLETPSHSKIRFPRSDQKLKDIIFADTGDGGNLFTGELTPEEDVWNADLPETLDPVMTFPDDFLDRIILEGFGKRKKAEKQDGLKKANVGKEKKVLPPVKELPQFSPANNLLPMETVKEEADSATQPGASKSGDLKGRDMLKALEENIENRLQSSLSSLVQNQEARKKEELSLIASLALENKVNDALASVGKEANNALASVDEKFDFNQPESLTVSSTADVKDQPEQVPSTSGVIQVQRSPAPELTRQIQDKNLTVPQLAKLLQNQGQNLSVSQPSPNKEKTVAQPLPPPDETISSIDKPRIPTPNTTNTTTTHPASQGKHNLNSAHTHFNKSLLKGISTNASRLQDGSTNVTNTSLTHGNFTTTDVSSVFANTSALTSSTTYPALVQQQQPAFSNLSASGDTDGKGVVMLYPPQPPPGELSARGQGRKSGLSQSDLHTLKENVIKADALFQRSFEQLKSEMRSGLHVRISPYRKKFLERLEPHIRVWGYNVSWSMVKQVCKEAVRKMRMKSSGWMAWSLWSSCTMTCGATGYQIRRRYCQPEQECLGSNYDLRPCHNQPECQGSSVWLDWTAWGRCSVTCGNGGVQFRMRTCLTDDPTMVCHGSGTEFINCSPQPCASDMTNIPNNQNSGPRKKRKDTHSHTGQVHWKKQKRNPVPATILKITPSETNTLVLPSAKPHHRHPRGRHHLRKRLRHSEYSEPDQVENVKILDSIVDDLQGVQDVKNFNREQHMTPLRITEKDMSSDPAQGIIHENLNDATWSVWGLWSECSVSCDRGTQFRRRQCVRRKEDSLDGQTVKSDLCQGKSRNRRVCTLFPCPISVAIPKTLVQLNEGKVGRLSCHNRLKGKVRFLYWITPSGEVVTNSSEDGKYVMENKTLTIHRAQPADLGQYQCVLVGANQIFMPELNKSTAEGHAKDKDNVDTCMENPCENGGQCEEVMDIWSTTHGMPIHYRCLCPVGFFGRHCEQKSLVHKYTPNLKVMGLVLLIVIILLCITCTCLCAYYWIEGKKRPVDIGPVMTRRRSEDQWRKMKSFDHKARSRKKSFSPREITKRLSRMWTGKIDEEEEKPTVKFGVNTSPYSELVSGLETPVQTEDTDDFKTDLTSSSTTAVPKRAGFINDISQNASPPTVNKDEGECEIGAELHNGQKCPDDFQNVEGHHMECADHQKRRAERFILQEPPPEFQDNQDTQRFHYEFKGNQKYSVNFQDNESSLTRFKDSLKHQTKLQDTQRQHAESKNCSNHVVIKLQDSKLYVDYLDGEKQNVKFVKKQGHDDFSEGGGASNDLQGIQSQSLHDMQRQSPGGRPTVVYSDDKMQMFSDSDLLHMQQMEERLKVESYSPFLGSSGESLHNPTTYIYRSQVTQDNVSPQSPPSCMTWHPKRKRRSKKWLRPGRNVEWEFNQNNSDDSSEGSPQPAGEKTNSEGTESTSNPPPPPPPGFSDHPSATNERGHDSAHQAESEEESDHGLDSASARAKGARPKVRHGPRHQSSGPSSRPSTAVSKICMAEARGGRKSPNDSRVSSGVNGQRLSLPVADHRDNMVPQLFRMYEVHHPDEPYPFRAARSRRRSRDWAEETPDASSADPGEQAEESAADSSMSRIQETQSAAACAQQSIRTIIPEQRPPNMSPHQPRHLEGGGEGASATVRTDSRKSGRDVLLRRAMENSYILATTGREPWRPNFLATERSASPEDGQCVACDQPTTSECVQSFQTSVRAKPESLSPSASTFSSPRAAIQIRTDQQDGLNSMARASADSHRDLMGQSLLQDRAASDFSSLQSNLHRVRPASGGQLQADNMNYFQKKGTWNSLGKVCTDSDSADRCNLKREKAESAKDDSFNPVSLRPNTSGANSNAFTTSVNRPLLSCFDSAGTSVVRRMSLPSDRATQENALKTHVSSASGGGGFRGQVPLTADTGREGSAHSQQLSDDQYFMDNTLESSFNMNQAITSANQDSSLAHLKRYSILDCTQGTQRKRVLKSAMKQQHSGYRLLPVQTKAHPLRRVSFSEPHIHIHNSLDTILDAERRGKLECTSDVAAEKHLETVGPEQVHPQTNSQLLNGCQGTGVSAGRDVLSSILSSAAGHELVGSKEDTGRLWPTSRRQTDKLRHGTFLHTQDLHQDDREEAAAPSDGWNLPVTSPDPSPPHSQALTCSQPESRSSFKTPATAGAPRSSVIVPTASGGDREGQPPLLVDIEGHSSSDAPLARQPQSTSPPVYSQRLLTPLTPHLAADHPAFADHQRGDVLPAVRTVWEGERGRGAEAGDTQHAGPGASTQSAPTVTGHLSLHSFQEMLVRRTPGAFFKPIDGSQSSHKSDD